MLRSIVMLFSLIGVTVVLRWRVVDPEASARRNREIAVTDVVASPGPEVLSIVTFEHPQACADVVWLAIVQELGVKRDGRPRNWDRLQRWANIATDADPPHYLAYYAPAVHLSAYAYRVDASDQLLTKATRALPERWELPFVLGYNAYFLRGDADTASTYWLQASGMKDAPHYLAALSARARFQGGDEDGAMEILETMVTFLQGPQRDDALIRLKLMKTERILREYDDACTRFREANGRLPKDGAELHRLELVSSPPVDLFGDPITFQESCVARTKLTYVREFEAMDNVGMERRRGLAADERE